MDEDRSCWWDIIVSIVAFIVDELEHVDTDEVFKYEVVVNELEFIGIGESKGEIVDCSDEVLFPCNEDCEFNDEKEEEELLFRMIQSVWADLSSSRSSCSLIVETHWEWRIKEDDKEDESKDVGIIIEGVSSVIEDEDEEIILVEDNVDIDGIGNEWVRQYFRNMSSQVDKKLSEGSHVLADLG